CQIKSNSLQITAAPVPVDMRALKALKRSPLALDLYSWATYTAYQTQRRQQSRFISWELLHAQLGAEYTEMRNFQTKVKQALQKIKSVYPDLGLDYEKGGVRILPSKPAVTMKTKSIKK
ncbi:MAG: replication protein RepA, partial [Flammeovirgaceae bacterium]